jgi:ABC-type lipoprotein release transport system permease subunit
MVRSATASFMGEGQIFGNGFHETMETERTLNHLDSVIAALKTEPAVEQYSVRTLSFAMISSPANVASVSLAGIQPDQEVHLSQIDDGITKGSFFGDGNPRALVIGTELAEILKVGLGDRVVVTAARVHSDDLSQEMFRVTGIFHLGMDEIDRGMIFAHLDKVQTMLNLPGQAHVIALKFTDMQKGQDKSWSFWDRYSEKGNIARGWTELMPQLEAVLKVSDFSTVLMAFILFGVVALGIINTLFMSIHERIFEFGVLRAVGTRSYYVASLVLFEAGALALLSIGFGLMLGFVITGITSQVGIDYTGIQFAGVTFRQLLYPVLAVNQFTVYPFWVFVFTIIVGCYPAIHTARMAPADALQKTF